MLLIVAWQAEACAGEVHSFFFQKRHFMISEIHLSLFFPPTTILNEQGAGGSGNTTEGIISLFLAIGCYLLKVT